MSELKNIQAGNVTFKWQLLATVSMVALAGAVCASGQTKAAVNDDDRSTVWIELGGQLESVSAGEEQFVPPFIVATPRPGPEKISPLGIPHAPRHSFGGEGKITFEPGHDGWVFSAAARYGRSEARQHLRQQSYPTQPILPTYGLGTDPVFQRALPFSDVEARSSESHAVLDFQVGRDVGVGLLGSGTRSTFNLGVRFAQFGSRSNVAFKSDPDAHPTFKYFPNGAKIVKGAIYHSNAAAGSAIRNFHGVGPSIAWSASAGIAGTNEEGKILLDWGVNAAVLFGRQKAVVHHQTTALYHHGAYPQARSGYSYRSTLYRNAPPDRVRSHSVVVPNIGGFAGLSFRYDTAKVSFGYRGDFFFGAMDGGIDARKTYNRNFYGPFATVSIGLGG